VSSPEQRNYTEIERLESLLAALRRQLPPHLRGIELKPGLFGSRAGLVGAALAGQAGSGWRQIR